MLSPNVGTVASWPKTLIKNSKPAKEIILFTAR
jgi:hypothetical protein